MSYDCSAAGCIIMLHLVLDIEWPIVGHISYIR